MECFIDILTVAAVIMFVGSHYKECSSDFWRRLWVHFRHDQQSELLAFSAAHSQVDFTTYL